MTPQQVKVATEIASRLVYGSIRPVNALVQRIRLAPSMAPQHHIGTRVGGRRAQLEGGTPGSP